MVKTKHSILKCLGFQLLEQISIKLLVLKHRSTSRKALLKLDDDMLKDIGVTRQQAFEEGYKPFWKGAGVELSKRDHRQPNFLENPIKKRLNRFLGKPVKSRGVSF